MSTTSDYLQHFTSNNQFCQSNGYTLIAEVNLDNYNRLVAESRHYHIKNLPKDQFIWGINNKQGKLVSILHMTYIYDNMYGADPGPQHIIQWCYSYTNNDYRRKGLSRLLRLASCIWANNQGYSYINSVPLPNSNSISLLENMGFTKCYDKYFDTSYYILDIRDITNLNKMVKKI